MVRHGHQDLRQRWATARCFRGLGNMWNSVWQHLHAVPVAHRRGFSLSGWPLLMCAAMACLVAVRPQT
eukprot:8366996-Pyramimonas_sp.AAC.1